MIDISVEDMAVAILALTIAAEQQHGAENFAAVQEQFDAWVDAAAERYLKPGEATIAQRAVFAAWAEE